MKLILIHSLVISHAGLCVTAFTPTKNDARTMFSKVNAGERGSSVTQLYGLFPSRKQEILSNTIMKYLEAPPVGDFITLFQPDETDTLNGNIPKPILSFLPADDGVNEYSDLTESDQQRDNNKATDRTELQQVKKNVDVMLLSFPKTLTAPSKTSSTASLFEEWKNYVLGHKGKPNDKALKAFNERVATSLVPALISHVNRDGSDLSVPSIELQVEASTICSNDKLELLLTVESVRASNVEADIKAVLPELVSGVLSQEMVHYKRDRIKPFASKLWKNIFSFSNIGSSSNGGDASEPSLTPEEEGEVNSVTEILSRNVVVTNGVYDTSHKLCLLASGLSERPTFKIFRRKQSSILARIKQASSQSARATNEGLRFPLNTHYSKILYDTALESGESAIRLNMDRLRLASLLPGGKMNPKMEVAARRMVVYPVVAKCCDRFEAVLGQKGVGVTMDTIEQDLVIQEEPHSSLDLEEKKLNEEVHFAEKLIAAEKARLVEEAELKADIMADIAELKRLESMLFEETQRSTLSVSDDKEETKVLAENVSEEKELKELKARITELEATLNEKHQDLKSIEESNDEISESGYARKVAEMENFRRTTKALSNIRDLSEKAVVLSQFLPIKEELDALVQKYDSSFGKKYSALAADFNSIFEEMGVQKFAASEGNSVDNARVTITGEESSENIPKGYIVRMINEGYELEGNLMRPASVMISSGPATNDDSPTKDETQMNKTIPTENLELQTSDTKEFTSLSWSEATPPEKVAKRKGDKDSTVALNVPLKLSVDDSSNAGEWSEATPLEKVAKRKGDKDSTVALNVPLKLSVDDSSKAGEWSEATPLEKVVNTQVNDGDAYQLHLEWLKEDQGIQSSYQTTSTQNIFYQSLGNTSVKSRNSSKNQGTKLKINWEGNMNSITDEHDSRRDAFDKWLMDDKNLDDILPPNSHVVDYTLKLTNFNNVEKSKSEVNTLSNSKKIRIDWYGGMRTESTDYVSSAREDAFSKWMTDDETMNDNGEDQSTETKRLDVEYKSQKVEEQQHLKEWAEEARATELRKITTEVAVKINNDEKPETHVIKDGSIQAFLDWEAIDEDNSDQLQDALPGTVTAHRYLYSLSSTGSHTPEYSIEDRQYYVVNDDKSSKPTGERSFILREHLPHVHDDNHSTQLGPALLGINGLKDNMNKHEQSCTLSWENAFAAALYFMRNPELISGKGLELSTGVGAVGILSVLSASFTNPTIEDFQTNQDENSYTVVPNKLSKILLTDPDERNIQNCVENLKATSFPSTKVDLAVYDVQRRVPKHMLNAYDFILNCDCSKKISGLARTLAYALKGTKLDPLSKQKSYGKFVHISRDETNSLKRLDSTLRNEFKMHTKVESLPLEKVKISPLIFDSLEEMRLDFISDVETSSFDKVKVENIDTLNYKVMTGNHDEGYDGHNGERFFPSGGFL